MVLCANGLNGFKGVKTGIMSEAAYHAVKTRKGKMIRATAKTINLLTKPRDSVVFSSLIVGLRSSPASPLEDK